MVEGLPARNGCYSMKQNMKMNPWDQLSDFFIADDDLSKIDPDVADNFLMAWPSLLKGIQLILSIDN